MVHGLQLFSEFFAGYEEKYVLIGGAACDIWLSRAKLRPRTTKDLDIVLILEALDASFIEKFWDFITKGGYKRSEVLSGKRQCYRFKNPTNFNFPIMLELFSRQPVLYTIGLPGSIIPITTDSSLSAISAILLEDDTYDFIIRARRIYKGVSLVDYRALIPLKAAAYVDLKTRYECGGHIDSEDIAKHKNDILKLSVLLSKAERVELPSRLLSRLIEFLSDIEKGKTDWNAIRKSILLAGTIDKNSIIDLIKSVYGILNPPAIR